MAPLLTVRHKVLSDIKGMEQYGAYIVDIEGNIWSTKNNKFKKLRPGWVVNRDGHLYVRLVGDNGKTIKNFYIHRMVALAFLPTNDEKMIVIHKDNNFKNNRVENLAWQKRVKHAKLLGRKKKVQDQKLIIDQFEIIRNACLKKGMNVPGEEEFMNTIIDNALEEYINRYGLRKILHTL